MSWLNEILSPAIGSLVLNKIGKNSRGFGGNTSSRSNTVDQVALPTSQVEDDPEVISQLTASVTDTRDPQASLPMIYTGPIELYDRPASGRQTGLTLAHAEVTGDNEEFLHLTYWITYGPIQGLDIVDTNYGDTLIENINSTGSLFSFRFDSSNSYYTSSEYDGYAAIFVHNGDVNNQATPDWHADTSFYPGIAYVKIRLELPDTSVETPPFTNVPNFIWHVYGKNPTQLVDDKTNKFKSRKALYLWDYLTSPVYGRGINSRDIDLASFLNVYELQPNSGWTTVIDGVTYGLSNYSHNIQYIDGNTSVGDAVTSMLGEMQCGLVFKRGRFYLRPTPDLLENSNNGTVNYGDDYSKYPGLLTFNITEKNIVGGLTFNPSPADRAVSKVKTTSVEYQRYVDTVDDVQYFLPQTRNYIVTDPDADPRNSNTVNLNYNGVPNVNEIKAEISNSKRSTLQFLGTGELLNADPYDIVTVNHYSYPSLVNYLFMITDTRLNMDMTVEIQAVLLNQQRSAANDALKDLLYEEELFAQDNLLKYVYDIPTSPILDYYQFNNQELDAYNYNLYRNSYSPGVTVDPTTGNTLEPNTVTGLVTSEISGAFDLDRTVSFGEYANTLTAKFSVSTALPLQNNIYLYLQVAPASEVDLNTNSWPNPPARFYPSNERYPAGQQSQWITEGDGTQQVFNFYEQLESNTNYVVRARVWDNINSEFVSELVNSFTTGSSSRFDDNTVFHQMHTLSGMWENRSDSAQGITAIQNSLGGSVRLFFYHTEPISTAKIGLHEFTFNIPTDLDEANNLPLYMSVPKTVIDSAPEDFFTDDIIWRFQFFDSEGVETYNSETDTFIPATYPTTDNIRLHRQYGFALDSDWDLSPYQRDILERTGNLGLLYD